MDARVKHGHDNIGNKAIVREDGGPIMQGTAQWIWCGLVGVMAVIGLFVAANAGAESPVGYWGGLGFFAFGVLFVLWQIKLGYDHAERG